MLDYIGVESMKSIKFAHSCTIKIPRTIPATIPTEKIRSISFICYVSRRLFACLSRGRFASCKFWNNEMIARVTFFIGILG
jgi:hypothetical protein